MKCGFPIKLGKRSVGCGQCMPCRINKGREWTGRILLEARFIPNKERSTFLTLTYNDENVPSSGNLSHDDLSAFIKALRQDRNYTPYMRFFAVGEYGDRTERPHYHLILFGADPLKYELLFQEHWKKGFTKTGEVNVKSAGYTVGYTTKKLTKMGALGLRGRIPEFARMSKRPPIGHLGVLDIIDKYTTKGGSAGLAKYGDITPVYRVDGKLYPLSYRAKKLIRTTLDINPPVDNPIIEWEMNDAQVTQQRAQQVRDLNNAKNNHDKKRRQSKSATYSRRSL